MHVAHDVLRVPASVTSSTLRWPAAVRDALFAQLTDPVVLFVHPWEFVDFRRSSLRFDCRFKTGTPALDCARSALRFFAQARRRVPIDARLCRRVARGRGRDPSGAALSALGTRLPVLAIGGLAVWLVGTWPPPTSEALWRVSGNEIRNLLARWDTFWYYSIATEGYHWDAARFQHENVVFFPLYPLLMRWGGRLLGGHPLAAGLIVSLASFTGAVVLLYRLAVEDLGEAHAGPAILLLVTYPFALFYSAVYTESLFLFLTVGAFYAMRRDRVVTAAVLGLAAGLTRPNGCWLMLPLLWIAWERTSGAIVPAPIVALGAADRPGRGNRRCIRRISSCDSATRSRGCTGRPRGACRSRCASARPTAVVFARAPSELYTDVLMWTLNIVAFVGAAAAIRPIYRRFGPPYALWVGFTIGPPVLTHLFMSLGRFTSVLFPLFFWLATVIPRRSSGASPGGARWPRPRSRSCSFSGARRVVPALPGARRVG